MTRREFIKKSMWVLLSIPFVSFITKSISRKISPREARYYEKLAG